MPPMTGLFFAVLVTTTSVSVPPVALTTIGVAGLTFVAPAAGVMSTFTVVPGAAETRPPGAPGFPEEPVSPEEQADRVRAATSAAVAAREAPRERREGEIRSASNDMSSFCRG